jgi:hypothetical protein
MTPKCQSNVHCHIQHDAMCFAPWPQIAPNNVLNLVCFDLLNYYINVYQKVGKYKSCFIV